MPLESFDEFTRRHFLALTGAALGSAGIGTMIGATPAMAQTPTKGGLLKVSISVRPTTMNPLKSIGSIDYVVSELLYNGLTKIGEDLKPIPELAEKWTANPENTEFTFNLRTDVTFKSGEPLKAADVVATIKAILDPKTASPAMNAIGPINSVAAPDDKTVVFTLSEPYADLAYSLANPNARIVPASILASNPKALDTEDHGSGPFKLKKFDPSQIIQVTRNDSYFGNNGPHVDGIDLVLYPDAVAEVGGLLNGETDIMMTVNPPEYERLDSQKNITRLKRPTGGFLNLIMRCDQPPFNDARIRKALALTIDREMLVELVLNGFGRPAYDSVISSEYPFYKDIQFKPDIAKAKALLAEAGHPNGLKVSLFAAANPPQRTDLAVAVKEMARPAGFDIDVQTIPMDTFIATVRGKGNFYVGNWQGQPTQDMQFTKLLTSTASLADSYWNNKAFDALVKQGESVSDPAKRAEIYGKAQELLSAEAPYIVPFFKDALSAHRSYVHGYFVHPLVQPNFLERVWLDSNAPKRA